MLDHDDLAKSTAGRKSASKAEPSTGWRGDGRPDLTLRRATSAPPSPDLYFFLQRAAGNQAIQRSLKTYPTVSRWPVPGPLPPQKDRSVAPSGSLAPADRKRIEAETAAEIPIAFTAFTDACSANITAMRAAAKADAEFAALIIDIASGFLAPAFASYVGKKLAARAGIKAASAPALDVVSKGAVDKLITQSDVLKASYTTANKVVNHELKQNSTKLWGEGADDAFLGKLKIEFSSSAVTLAGQVPSMRDDQLIATWMAYDPQVTNAETYKGVIKKLLDEYHLVEDLGVHTIFCDDCQDQNHLLVEVAGLGYAIVEQDVETFLYDAGPYQLMGLVHSYLIKEAKRRAQEVGQERIPTLKASDVKGLPANIKPWGTQL